MAGTPPRQTTGYTTSASSGIAAGRLVEGISIELRGVAEAGWSPSAASQGQAALALSVPLL